MAHEYTAPDLKDEYDGYFDVFIPNFTLKREQARESPRFYSDVFDICGIEWRLIYFPLGNRVNCFGVYLEIKDKLILEIHSIEVNFQFTLMNIIN
jgi:hypothetical protein